MNLDGVAQLGHLFQLFPKAKKAFYDKICDANLQKISNRDFRKLKTRVATAIFFLYSADDPSPAKRHEVIKAILTEEDLQAALKHLSDTKESIEDRGTGWMDTVTTSVKASVKTITGVLMPTMSTQSNHMQGLLMRAHEEALDISDPDFLRRCRTASKDEEVHKACEQLRQLAHAHFTSFLSKKLQVLKNVVLSIQEGECQRQLHLEVEATRSDALAKARHEFLSQIQRSSESTGTRV